MNIEYFYVNKRSAFGSPCSFTSSKVTLIDNVYPNKLIGDQYTARTYVNKAIQESTSYSASEVNTWRTDYSERGMFHDQGGWPKELNMADEEAVVRYKKKLEREDNYIGAMKGLSKIVEHAILQNNAVNIYEVYFSEVLKTRSLSETLSQIRSVYRDISPLPRPVSHISWSPDGETLFACSYCNTKFQRMDPNEATKACVWDVEIPNYPQTIFDSQIPILNIEWNPGDRHLLVGGLYNGQIAIYDPRKSPEHVEITTDVVSHRDPVHSVLWTNSKLGVDFFSTSSDGIVKWWDCRNLSKILDSIILDMSKVQSFSTSYPPSVLEYDSTVPAKYLVGTESGYVICGNRKGITMQEKMPWAVKTHFGPVNSLERNAAFSKIFLTVGDCRGKIWTEDCKESPVIWTMPYKTNLNGGGWSRSRYSVFFVIRNDGYLDVWDILTEQKNAILSIRVSDKPLSAIRAEEHGKFLVTGDDGGNVYLIQLGESLSSCQKNDRVMLSAMFDRESRREKVLETRTKEIRLAMRLKATPKPNDSKETLSDTEMNPLKVAEDTYWREVNKSLEEEKRRQTEIQPMEPLPDLDYVNEEEEEEIRETELEPEMSIGN